MKIEVLSADFRKILKCKISRKSFPLEPSCSMRTEKQTHEEANSRFSQYCERAKSGLVTLRCVLQFSVTVLERPRQSRGRALGSWLCKNILYIFFFCNIPVFCTANWNS